MFSEEARQVKRNMRQALGLMFLTFGLWLLFDGNNLSSVLFSSGKNQLAAFFSYILLGIGSVITFTSATRLLGSVVEVKCLLVTVHNQWNNRIDELISEYGNKSLAEQEPVWNILNAVQHNMECCGRYNVTQWERNKKENGIQVPYSRTKSSLKKWFCDVPRNSMYRMGCEEHLNTWFENNVLILTAITVSLLITQIFLITLTGLLFGNIRKNIIWPLPLVIFDHTDWSVVWKHQKEYYLAMTSSEYCCGARII